MDKKKILILAVGFLLFAATVYAWDVKLTWDLNTEPDIDKYKIYQSNTSNTYLATPIETVSHPTNIVEMTNLPDGTYYWVVTAVDKVGNESGYSNEVTKTFLTPDTAPPAPPSNVKLIE